MSAKTSDKFSRLIAAGRELFSRYGIRRVSVDEICQHAGVSKMTFYKHFSNKTQLALQIFDDFNRQVRAKFDQIVAEAKTFPELFRELGEFKLRMVEQMADEFLMEFIASPDPEIRAYIAARQIESLQAFHRVFSDAQQKGEIRPDLKIELVDYLLNKLAEMMQDPLLHQMYPDLKALSQDLMNFLLYGIASRGKDYE